MSDPGVAFELAPLRDVEGVIGSFVLSAAGVVLGRDLPSLIDGETLGSVGLRSHRLLESFEEIDDSDTHLTLRFAEHKLYLHRNRRAIVGVLAGAATSSPAMTMALTLVGRRIARRLRDSVGEGTPTGPSTAPTLPAVPRPTLPGSESPPETPASTTQYGFVEGGRVPARAPEGRLVPKGTAPPAATRPRYFRGRRVE